MSLAREYTEDWFGYWTYVWQRATDGWYRAMQQMQEREYEPKHVVSDVISYWNDVGVATLTAWRGQDRRPPIVVFRVQADDDCRPSETVPVFRPSLPVGKPEVILYAVGTPSTDGLQPEHIVAQLRSRSELEIRLALPGHDSKGKKKPLAAGNYRALIHIDEVPLAELFIVVEATKKS